MKRYAVFVGRGGPLREAHVLGIKSRYEARDNIQIGTKVADNSDAESLAKLVLSLGKIKVFLEEEAASTNSILCMVGESLPFYFFEKSTRDELRLYEYHPRLCKPIMVWEQNIAAKLASAATGD